MKSELAPSFQGEIQSAWRYRENMRLEDFVLKVLELNQRFRLDLTHLKALELSDSELLELLLLNVSLLRSRLKIDAAMELWVRIEAWLLSQHLPASFKFYSENGLNQLFQGRYLEALEQFISARTVASKAGSPAQETSALLNSLVCLEKLNLPRTETERQLTRMSGKISDLQTEHVGLWSQMQAYEMRSAFQEGELGKIFSVPALAPGQPSYFRLWLRALPYASGSLPAYHEVAQADLEIFMREEQAYRRSYRLRTLQYSLSAEDLSLASLSDRVDRIYLWVWKWNTTFDPVLLNRIMKTLETFPDWSLKGAHALDSVRLRLSLRWIRILDSKSAIFVDQALARIPRSAQTAHAVFSLEELVLSWLETRISGDASRTSETISDELQNHPVWNSHDLFFREIMNSLSSEPLKGPQHLKVLIQKLIQKLDLKRRSSAPIEVDTDAGTLLIKDQSSLEGSTRILSEPLSLAMALMAGKDSVSFEEFMAHVYGIHRYDSVLHQPRVYNLISRMKQVLGDTTALSTRNGKIFRTQVWSHVFVNGADSGSRKSSWQLLSQKAFSQLQTRGVVTSELLAGSRVFELEAITVHDWIQALNRPRSTTLRLVKSWVDRGLLLKKGTGKKTIYKIKTATALKEAMTRDL